MDENSQESADTAKEISVSEQLETIRTRAINALGETLQQDGNMEPIARFNAALSILKYGTNVQAAQVALDAAIAVEVPSTRTELLTQLVNEVDFLIESVK